MAEVVQQQKAFSTIPTDDIPSFKVPTENPKPVAPSPVQQDAKEFSNTTNKETSINIYPTEGIQEEKAADNTETDAKTIQIESENEQDGGFDVLFIGKDARDGVSSANPTVHTNAETSPEKLQDEDPRTGEHTAFTDDACVEFSTENIQETKADGESEIVIDSASIDLCTEQVEEDDAKGEHMVTITTLTVQKTHAVLHGHARSSDMGDRGSQTNGSPQ